MSSTVWNKCEEEAPPKNKSVDICDVFGTRVYNVTYSYTENGQFYFVDDALNGYQAKYWKPKVRKPEEYR